MAKRKRLPAKTVAQVLVPCRRRCCICFGLHGDSSEKKGQIAHLDHDSSNNELDNLAFLCLDHHDQYDSKTSQSKGMSAIEVKEYRTQLYQYVEENLPRGGIDSTNQGHLDILDQKDIDPIMAEQSISISPDVVEFVDLKSIADELGISEAQFCEDLDQVAGLLSRISEAELTKHQRCLLSLVVENIDGSDVPRRVIESAAGYEYLSQEFFEEMTVIEYRGLILFSPGSDGQIHIIQGDIEAWQMIKYLAEKAQVSLRDVIDNLTLEILLPNGK